MEKRKLRNSLLALAMAPCFLIGATGCTNKNDVLSEAKQNEAYSVLRNNIINDNFLTETTSNAIVFDYSTKYTISTDWSNSNVPEDKKEYVASELELPIDSGTYEYNYLSEYGYNPANNTGYHIQKGMEYDKDTENNELDTESFRITDMEFTKQTDGVFYKYDYEYRTSSPDDKELYLVDDKHAVNYYKNEALDEIREGVDLIGKYIKENKTLLAFASNSAIASRDIIYYLGDMDFLDNLTTSNMEATLDVTLTNGIYSLTVSASIDDLEDKETGDLYDISLNTNVKFDNDSIEYLEYNIKMSYYDDFKCKNEFGTSLDGVTFDDDDHIDLSGLMDFTVSVDFNNEFNANNIPEDVSGYVGTGENNAIITEYVDIDFIYLDFEDFDDERHFRFNEPLNLNNYSSYYFVNDHVTKTYYWDKECTRPVQSSDVAPSYDSVIYVKLTVDDGYAAINERQIYEDGDISNKNQTVINISSDSYQVYDHYNNYYINYVYVNGKKTYNYYSGITLTESGCCTIDVYTSYKHY